MRKLWAILELAVFIPSAILMFLAECVLSVVELICVVVGGLLHKITGVMTFLIKDFGDCTRNDWNYAFNNKEEE